MNARIIVSAIIQKDESIVLGKKAKGQPPYPDVWHLPGGGVKDQELGRVLIQNADYNNEYFHSELQREVKEETGLEIQHIKNIIPKYRKIPREGENTNKEGEVTRYCFLEFLCNYKSGELTPGDDIVEVRWIPKIDLPSITVTKPSVEMYKELGWL